MIKIFQFFFIFALISSKSSPSVKLGVNTTFDMNNNEFNFEYKGPGKDIIIFYIKSDNYYFDYDLVCPNTSMESSISGGTYASITATQVGTTGTCTIKFESEKESKGSFVIYTIKSKLSIKLKNKYGNLIFADEDDDSLAESISQLTFSVPKLDRDVTANFEYSKDVFIHKTPYTIENPFKVYHGKDFKENISTYEFKKGESYEINVKVSKVTDEYNYKHIIIPGFTFYDQKYNGTYSPDDILDTNSANVLKIKLLFISLFLLIL